MTEIWQTISPHLVTAGYIALCLVLFSVAVAIHEFGHFIFALLLGLRVERFSIGFGPAIVKWHWGKVEYRISWIPLGGYVSIPDIDPEGTKAIEGEAAAKKERIPPWKEIVVAFAGPMMNIVLAVAIAFLLAAIPQAKFGELPTEISGFVVNPKTGASPAKDAGMLVGDRVISVGGHQVDSWTEMQTEVQIADEHPTEFIVMRGEEEVSLTVTPMRDEVTGACYIGALSIPNENQSSAWMPARNPLKQLAWDAESIFRALKGLVTPKEMKATGKALGGPVMIAEGIYNSVRRDIWDGLGFLRFLNVNLAVLNLLPIPVLDGGLIMFALIALIFRRRVPDKVVNTLSLCFMVLLMAAMAFLIFRDSMRSWRIHTYKPDEPAAETLEAESEGSEEDVNAAPDESVEGR